MLAAAFPHQRPPVLLADGTLSPQSPRAENGQFGPELFRLLGQDSTIFLRALSLLPPDYQSRGLSLLTQGEVNWERVKGFLWSLIQFDCAGHGTRKVELADELQKLGLCLPDSLSVEASRRLQGGSSLAAVAEETGAALLLHLFSGNKSTFRESTGNKSASRQNQFQAREERKQRLVASLRECQELGNISVTVLDKVERCYRQCRAYLAPECPDCDRQRRVELRPNSCGFPLCPHCQHKRSLRLRPVVEQLLREMEENASRRGATVKFITLTVPNLDSLDGEVFTQIRAGFGKLRRRNFLKDRLKGGMYVIETTNEGRGWNIHIHVVADCDYLDQPDLASFCRKTRNSL